MRSSVAVACVALGAGGVVASEVRADAFDAYGLAWRAFSTPPVGDGSFGVAGGALPDGRLVMVTGNSVYLESGLGTAQFDEVAIFDASETGGATDPAFVTVSAGGRIAVGAGFGRPLAVFDSSALGTPDAPTVLTSGVLASYYHVGHYDAAWYDGTSLGITAGDFGSPAFVTLLDTTSDPDAPVNPVVVSGIAGASAGLAFDGDGRLFTANGFADGSGDSDTGWIKAFAPGEWGSGLDFEIGGVLIGDVLSGGSLEFDVFGHLAVGGGDFGEFDAGYMGLIHADAIAAALAGFGPIDASDPGELKRLDPRGDGFGYFGAAYNGVSGALYVTDGTMWYATVPGPGGVVVLAVGVCVWGWRRG